MDSDSDNQSDSTEQMDESDDLEDLRVSYPESADIIIRNFNRKSSHSINWNFGYDVNSFLANPMHELPPLPNNTVSYNYNLFNGPKYS